MRKASKKLVPGSTACNKRWLGMHISVSTVPSSSASPCSACNCRRRPSKAKGLVTTATVSAPSSLAKLAIIGAAPVPVPPPSPAVMNTMSAPCNASTSLSVSSSAACRPISGLAPDPRPLVSFAPSCSLSAALDCLSACKSVLAARNSTPRTRA